MPPIKWLRRGWRGDKMQIRNIEAKPYEKSISPSISFEVELDYKKFREAIIGIDGYLMTDDQNIITPLFEIISNPIKIELGAKGSKYDIDFKDEIYRTELIAILNNISLEIIRKSRKKYKNKDVKFTICINVKYIEAKATIFKAYRVNPEDYGLPPIEIYTSKGKSKGVLVIYNYDPKYESGSVDNWIISGEGSNVFLLTNIRNLTYEKVISSQDWINIYSPKLGLGEYFIVEIPKGDKFIKEAWDLIEEAEKDFRMWDSQGVYANCRNVGYLLERTLKNKFGKKNFNYEEKWIRTYKRFEDLTSLALHIEEIKESKNYNSDEVKVNSFDCENILNSTKLLIKYAEELIREI